MIVVEVASALCVLAIAHASWQCRRQINHAQDADEDRRDWERRPTERPWIGSFPRWGL